MRIISAFCLLTLAVANCQTVDKPLFETGVVSPPGGFVRNSIPCVALTPGGRLLVTWAVPSGELANKLKVVYSISGDNGKTWTTPVTLIDNPGKEDADPSIIVDGSHIIHQLARRLAARLHSPVMHNLEPSAGLVDQGSQEFMHGYFMTGFFQHLALGGIARRFAVVELAFGKNPFIALAQPHHRDQRGFLLPQHNASRRQNRRSRHLNSLMLFESRSSATYNEGRRQNRGRRCRSKLQPGFRSNR